MQSARRDIAQDQPKKTNTAKEGEIPNIRKTNQLAA